MSKVSEQNGAANLTSGEIALAAFGMHNGLTEIRQAMVKLRPAVEMLYLKLLELAEPGERPVSRHTTLEMGQWALQDAMRAMFDIDCGLAEAGEGLKSVQPKSRAA